MLAAAYANFKDYAKALTGQGAEVFSRVKDSGTLRRIVFACYLIGNADGEFDSDEKASLVTLIQQKMPHFQTADIRALIQEADGKLEFDKKLGEMELLDVIAKAKGDEARTIVNAAVYVANSDDNFDDSEKNMVRKICQRLALPPENYGL